MTTPVVVRFENISKRFGPGPEVLSGISIAAHEGDFLSLIGPSGCGKSTMLRMVSGLTEPTEGVVQIGTGCRPRVAHIFQDATLLPWLSVWGNIEAPLLIQGMASSARSDVVERMLKLVRLESVSRSFPRQLSGGMKMRVSVARALAQTPDILLLDEPFGALDAMTRNHLNEELLGLREHQKWTAFFVTHSVTEAVFLSNRIGVLGASPGRLVAEVPVPFEFPRRNELRETREFQELVVKVSRILRTTEGQGNE